MPRCGEWQINDIETRKVWDEISLLETYLEASTDRIEIYFPTFRSAVPSGALSGVKI